MTNRLSQETGGVSRGMVLPKKSIVDIVADEVQVSCAQRAGNTSPEVEFVFELLDFIFWRLHGVSLLY